jgi:uncharacterized protein YcbK (DUF882 family)
MPYTRKRSIGWLTWGALAAFVCVIASPAAAEQDHQVGKGQTLSGIADRYGVSVSSLAAANGLARDSSLREGQLLVVPPQGVLYVSSGDTLAAIARRHDVSVAELARTNRVPASGSLRIGQRLLLPGHQAAAKQQAAEHRWGRPKRRGNAVLYRDATREKRSLPLVDRRGRVPPDTLRVLARLMRPRADKRRGKEPHPRLVRLLARVSDHFGGRPIHVVSGYRRAGGFTKDTSRHVAGQAIDFRIPGVPLEVLRDYCSRLRHVGIGYYPNSHFVHLDVRRKDARWTDRSRPGEAPQIVRPGDPPVVNEDVPDEPPAEDDGKPPIDDAPRDPLAPDPLADTAL